METRPAPLGGMSGSESLDEFRVFTPRDVGLLLKQLLDGSVLLNLNGSDGRVFTSAIWTLDSTRCTIGFNADPNDPSLQSILHSREVTRRRLPRERQDPVRRAPTWCSCTATRRAC